MPELPEVEHYRQILLKCKLGLRKQQKKKSVYFEFGPPPLPTTRFPSEQTIRLINNGNYNITDVLRKGKVLCVVLKKRAGKTPLQDEIIEEADDITGNEATILLSLHMGMTGRLSSPNHIPKLESLSGECSYPPPHTHLIINSANGQQACFSDPRRFGSVFVHSYQDGQNTTTIDEQYIPAFQELAPDALTASSAQISNPDNIVNKFVHQKKGIKAILLDQRQVISGVGNWVADEVLYRSMLHPDQSFLIISEATKLVSEIQYVLSTAVECLNDGEQLPEHWLFHRRWRGGGSSGTKNSKDFNGKTISFVKSGGRSSAIVPSLQKKVARKVVIAADTGIITECKKKKSATKQSGSTSAKRRKR